MEFRKLFLIGLFIIPLLSCDNAEYNFETNTELVINLSLNATPLSIETKSNTREMYFFEGSKVFCLVNKDKLQNYPGNILAVLPGKGATLRFSELENHNKIYSLKLIWGHAPYHTFTYNMHDAIPVISESGQPSNGEFIVDVDELLQPVIGKMNENPRAYIFIMLAGESNAKQTIKAQLKVPLVVKSEIVSPHFSL